MESSTASPDAIKILLATLDRDNRHIESFTLQNQQLTDQLTAARRSVDQGREIVAQLQRDAEEIDRRLGREIELTRDRLGLATTILMDVAKAAKFFGWDDRQRFSDRGSLEAQIADRTKAFMESEATTAIAPRPQVFVAVEHESPDPAPHTPRKDFNRDEMTGSERYVFEQLAKAATKDGDLASKVGRDGLFEKGLIVRFGGINALSPSGIERAVEEGLYQ
jgi:hypothetical protein